jgi:hypothetical protein
MICVPINIGCCCSSWPDPGTSPLCASPRSKPPASGSLGRAKLCVSQSPSPPPRVVFEARAGQSPQNKKTTANPPSPRSKPRAGQSPQTTIDKRGERRRGTTPDRPQRIIPKTGKCIQKGVWYVRTRQDEDNFTWSLFLGPAKVLILRNKRLR